MVDAQQVHHGGVKIINGGDAIHSLVPEFIGGTIAVAAFHASTAQKNGETSGIMISAAGAFWNVGMRPNSVTSTTRVSSRRPVLFRSAINAAAGWSKMGACTEYCWTSVLCPSQFPTPSPMA